MRFPALQVPETVREVVDGFLGLNKGGRIEAGEFSDMENLSSDAFPLLSPRGKRGVFARPQNLQGMIGRDVLCWVDGSRFVMDGYSVEMGLSEREEDCPKRLVNMGAYVVIFPDKKYINTANLTDFGELEAEFVSRGTVKYTPAGLDGQERIPNYVQAETPTEPENLALWLDTARNVLMEWSASAGMWVEAAQGFVRIECANIGAAFGQYDGVEIVGGPMEGSSVIWERGTDFILVPGVLAEAVESEEAVTVRRRLPEMDFVMECGNRLWGCKYGVDGNGQPVNEIYASKLGDFKNWNCFMGLSTDSYAVSLGNDGAFTGAVCHMGYPVFFREGCMHRVYGNVPSNFRLQTTPCRGVQRGCEKSLAILGEMLYYKSTTGVCVFDGALPTEISQKLGAERYSEAVGGVYRGKYYLSMKNAGGEYRLFVYDSMRNLWHLEDEVQLRGCCGCRDELYLWRADGTILTVSGDGQPEEAVRWMAQTGELGVSSPDTKYLSRLSLRMWLDKGTWVKVLVRYDSVGRWEQAALLRGNGLGSFTLPLRVRRCDHLMLRLEGVGDARLFCLTKTVEQGSEEP